MYVDIYNHQVHLPTMFTADKDVAAAPRANEAGD